MDNTGRIVAANDTVSMSAAAADKLLRRRNSTAALLYIYILRRGCYDEVAAVNELGLEPAIVRAAFGVLQQEGLVHTADAPTVSQTAPLRIQSDEPPEYTAEDIKNRLAVDKTFSALVKEVQGMLGSLLSSADTMRLYGIYDHLGFAPEVLLMLVTHCIEETQRHSGPGRMPTMRYIERAAYQWEKEGVSTPEQVEAYIRRHERLSAKEKELCAALQISDRGLFNGEKAFVQAWLEMGFGTDAVEIAMNKSVLNTGKRNFKYMDSIFRSWHGKGLHTAEEIMKGDGRQPTPKPRPAAQRQSATAEDLERMRRYLEGGGR